MTGMVLLVIRTMLALALYAFLYLALTTIWRDLREQKAAVQSQQPPEIRLQIQISDETYRRVFRGVEITLGRDPICECILPSEAVSAHHARFAYHHGQWWLEDLKSTNGTFINGEMLNTSIVVIPGDQVQCGDVEVTILEE